VVLLISTYDLGRQSFGLASAAAALKAAGHEVICADLAKQKLEADAIARADAIAFFLPMHTATRLAIPVIHRARAVNPSAHLIAYGLYAPLNAPLLRESGVATIVGGEFEDALVRALDAPASDAIRPADDRLHEIARVTFRVPDRTGLLPLARYATLQIGAERRVVGYTEASRGCKHRCRHCPIVPVYDGRFRIVPVDVVIADVAAQVAAGARHITFGDPDFFNGIKHAAAVLEAFARHFPEISYDVTIKVEHLLAHGDRLPMLRDTGCAFVTSAIESVDDRVLAALEKGHTRADFERIAERFREIGLTLSPTFVAFTPWTTIERYCDLLETIDRLDLADHVAPIQLAIRLLVTEGSRLLELPDVRSVLQPFNPRSLTYPWAHPDVRVDRLQKSIEAVVGVTLSAPRREVFARVWALAHDAAGRESRMRPQPPLPSRATVPYLNEPWYC
jgi:radical SAM superfamily enzyme YgiQ (UPF0313 family)